MDEKIVTVSSRKANGEDLFYLKLFREEFGKSLERIEEAAKFLAGAVSSVTGLLIAALQLSSTPSLTLNRFTLLFIFWSGSLLCSIFVLLPLPYRHYKNSPSEIKRTFIKARWIKWSLLLGCVLMFILGLLIGIWKLSKGI
jgi:hypothetical protein